MLSQTTLQQYENKESAAAGRLLLAEAGIEANIAETVPRTVYATFTPGARLYLLQVRPDDVRNAYFVLYRQEPTERPEKVWQFRDKGIGRQRNHGLRNLMLGGTLLSVSMAIVIGTYLFAETLHLLMPLGAATAGVLLMAKGWMQLRH